MKEDKKRMSITEWVTITTAILMLIIEILDRLM
jgi:hypothetical protein